MINEEYEQLAFEQQASNFFGKPCFLFGPCCCSENYVGLTPFSTHGYFICECERCGATLAIQEFSGSYDIFRYDNHAGLIVNFQYPEGGE